MSLYEKLTRLVLAFLIAPLYLVLPFASSYIGHCIAAEYHLVSSRSRDGVCPGCPGNPPDNRQPLTISDVPTVVSRCTLYKSSRTGLLFGTYLFTFLLLVPILLYRWAGIKEGARMPLKYFFLHVWFFGMFLSNPFVRMPLEDIRRPLQELYPSIVPHVAFLYGGLSPMNYTYLGMISYVLLKAVGSLLVYVPFAYIFLKISRFDEWPKKDIESSGSA